VIKAPPDGYTLLASGSVFWITPLLQKMFFDPEKDFSAVILTDKSPNILAVHPSLSVTSLKDLIALAKAKPGELNYASGQTGSSGHLAGELFKAMAGVNIVRIPYKGSALATNALLGGEVQLLFANDVSLMNHAKAGK
jgi:tripartite-type tricarboxylate transporter receptor subunit TctC